MKPLNTEIVSIQYLRAIAVLMVVAFHFVQNGGRIENEEVLRFSSILQSGVDLFFVISGFIMWHTTRKVGATPARFLCNRLIRIVPLYWLVTFFVLGVALVRPDALRTAVFDLNHAAASLLFIPWHHPFHNAQIWPVVIPGWSLNYEMFFYVAFAVSLFMRTQLSLIYLLSFFVTVFVAAHFTKNPIIHDFYGNSVMMEFLFGIIIGVLASSEFRLAIQVSIIMICGGFLFLALSIFWNGPRVLQWGVPAFAIVCGAVLYELLVNMPSWRALKVLGDAFYLVYLFHGIVFAAALRLLGLVGLDQTGWVIAIICTLASVLATWVIGIASYKQVEQRLSLALKRLLSGNRRLDTESGIV